MMPSLHEVIPASQASACLLQSNIPTPPPISAQIMHSTPALPLAGDVLSSNISGLSTNVLCCSKDVDSDRIDWSRCVSLPADSCLQSVHLIHA